ncbi:MAG: hypothetical protein ACRD43_09900, partial [Pyrinomonadaceae bacterium]
ALTTRGMKETEMTQIGELIASIILESESDEVKRKVRQEVAEITDKFPMYPNRLKQGREGQIAIQ